MAGKVENLIVNSDLTPTERTKKASKAGKASAEARKKKKTMRETAKMLMEMNITNDQIRDNLRKVGIEDNDLNYQTAMIVRLMQKGIQDGDTQAIKLFGELTGQLTAIGFLGEDNDPNVIDMRYPTVAIPDNGRDKPHETNLLRPQAGPQTAFMSSSADIVIYGGAAGGGKTYSLLLEGLRHRNVLNFGAVIFRKNFTQITAEGGLWDASRKIYGQVEGATSRNTPRLHWEFQGGGKLSFAHIDREDDLKAWQGTEICYLAFDELTHFSKHMFTYMLSRNRSTCGIRPYVRCTCNPDSDSWVADFISWWIDQDTGYPIKARSGQIRYMTMLNDTFLWGDSPEELAEQYDVNVEDCKSVTFIASRLEDNKILMETDPSYMSNLKAMTEVDRERLLLGNWKIKASAGKYFQRTQIELISTIPTDIVMWCRAWDLAATAETENNDADYTAGVLMGKRSNGTIVVLDVVHERIKAGDVEKLVLNTSLLDKQKYGYQYIVRMAKDPGQAGKVQAQNYIKLLSGFNVKAESISGSKELRATPFAAQWQNGNIEVLLAPWNDSYFSELESFPDSKHDDMVDASADSFTELTEGMFDISSLL